MQKKNDIDIVDRILEACYKNKQFPLFIMSLMHQYEERGSLSKKQLQGLYYKAEKVPDMPANWLATLQAKIARMPDRFRQEQQVITKPSEQKDDSTGTLIRNILEKYPQHKRVLFLQTKYTGGNLGETEKAEIERFGKLLL